jgi:hypothetical protein
MSFDSLAQGAGHDNKTINLYLTKTFPTTSETHFVAHTKFVVRKHCQSKEPALGNAE